VTTGHGDGRGRGDCEVDTKAVAEKLGDGWPVGDTRAVGESNTDGLKGELGVVDGVGPGPTYV
jgi:hypothetical protein